VTINKDATSIVQYLNCGGRRRVG